MSERDEPPQNKEDLIARINVAWEDLQATLAGLTEEQLTVPRDAQGWSAKDHLAHLADWERSVVGLVRDRRPRYTTLGIDQALFASRDFDKQNAVILAATRDRSLAEVRADLSNVHREMLALLATLSEQELATPASEYVAGDADSPVYALVNGDTWDHYDEHRVWIAELVGRNAAAEGR